MWNYKYGEIILVRGKPFVNDSKEDFNKGKRLIENFRSSLTFKGKDGVNRDYTEGKSIGYLYFPVGSVVDDWENGKATEANKKMPASFKKGKVVISEKGWVWADQFKCRLPYSLFQEGVDGVSPLTQFLLQLRDISDEIKTKGLTPPYWIFEGGLMQRLFFRTGSASTTRGAYLPLRESISEILPVSPAGRVFFRMSDAERRYPIYEKIAEVFSRDMKRLAMYLQNPSQFDTFKYPDTDFIYDEHELSGFTDRICAMAEEQDVYMAFDIESHPNRLLCIGFYGTGMEKPISVYLDLTIRSSSPLLVILKDFFKNEKIQFIAQNMNFDIVFLQENFNFEFIKVHDTMIRFRAAHNTMTASLAFIASYYLTEYQLWKFMGEDIANWDSSNTYVCDNVMQYNGIDCYITYMCYLENLKELSAKNMTSVAHQLEQSQRVLSETGSVGIQIDYSLLRKYYVFTLDAILEAYRAGVRLYLKVVKPDLLERYERVLLSKDIKGYHSVHSLSEKAFNALLRVKRLSVLVHKSGFSQDIVSKLYELEHLMAIFSLSSRVDCLTFIKLGISPDKAEKLLSVNKKILNLFMNDNKLTEDECQFLFWVISLRGSIYTLNFMTKLLEDRPVRLKTSLSIEARTYRATSKSRDFFEETGSSMQNISGRGLVLGEDGQSFVKRGETVAAPKRFTTMKDVLLPFTEKISTKGFFVPRSGYVFVSMDLSAADAWFVAAELNELGYGAFLQDLLDAKPKPDDYHTQNAAYIYQKDALAVTKSERDSTKNFLYACLYDAQVFTLHMLVPSEPIYIAKKAKEHFDKKYQLGKYKMHVQEEVLKNGGVSTVFGAFLKIIDLDELKAALNAIPQCSVSFVTNSIAVLYADRKKAGLEVLQNSYLTTQTHDSLQFEVKIEKAQEFLTYLVENLARVTVPYKKKSFIIPVEAEITTTWS